jgi:hypothetical protein
MRVLSRVVLTATLLAISAGCPKAELPDYVTSVEKSAMERPCYPRYGKGGVGIVANDLYVLTKSKANEIQWGEGENSKKWLGEAASKPEIAIFFNDRVWPPQSVPQGFDKSKSVVISFEQKFIRFYDYARKNGCNYERDPKY